MTMNYYYFTIILSCLAVHISAGANTTDYCNGNGQLHCACNSGYEGDNCEIGIDWCNEQIGGVASNATIGSVCSEHGSCFSHPSEGVTCACQYGFTGPLCGQVIDGEESYSRRCALYNTSQVIAAGIQVGCPAAQRCLSDDLDCAYSHCDNPVGWCVNKPTADRVFMSHFFHTRQAELMEATESRSGAACSGQGAPSCTCSYGHTGAQCDQDVNFCNQPLNGVQGSPPLSQACGHGVCITSVSGASCSCDAGFTGTFCGQAIPDQAFCGLRCLLYSSPGLSPSSNVTVGCASGERCLSDNLDCAFGQRNCPDPVGWCAPDPSAGGGLSPPDGLSPP